METKIYNIQGKEAGTLTLPDSIFGLPWNGDLVHQVVTAMQANARGPVAHTKDRGEVRGGGRKPWQQKGTGRARHGSSRSPIWKGGGVTHGPRNEKIYAQTVTRQARQKALLVTLSRKYKDGEIIFIDSLEMSAPKTAEAKKVLAALGSNFSGFNKKKNAALIALPTSHAATQKSFRNIGNVEVADVRNLNPVSVLGAKYLVIAEPKAAFEVLSAKKVVKK
ncbi:MAG TPA: 50S ribosomal protein L4 [Candidatus Paceibacterota bacterium]|nr:50S ribosomal protein L4 [Candidatus Paceibacterota bacterium]